MKLFLVKFFKFSGLLTVVFFLLGFAIEFFIQKQTENKQFLLQSDWHIKHKEKIDVLFIGNSRTSQHVDIPVLEKDLGIKAYSLSQDGRDSRVLYYKLLCYLKLNKKPETIFLQFDPYFCAELNERTFCGKENYLSYFFLDRLGINHIFEDEDGYSAIEAYVPLLRYFHCPPKGLFMLMLHLTGKSYNSHQFENGINIHNMNWQSTSDWDNPPKTTLQPRFKYIDSVSAICKAQNIKLVLVYPPQSFTSYKKVEPDILNKLDSFAKVLEVEYWNFNGEQYNEKDIFYNHMHLNTPGTKMYTEQLMNRMIAMKKQ